MKNRTLVMAIIIELALMAPMAAQALRPPDIRGTGLKQTEGLSYLKDWAIFHHVEKNKDVVIYRVCDTSVAICDRETDQKNVQSQTDMPYADWLTAIAAKFEVSYDTLFYDKVTLKKIEFRKAALKKNNNEDESAKLDAFEKKVNEALEIKWAIEDHKKKDADKDLGKDIFADESDARLEKALAPFLNREKSKN